MVATFASLLAAWSLIAPLLQSPDEPAHAALLRHVADDRSYPDYDEFHPGTGFVQLSIQHRPDVDDSGLRPPGRGRWLTPENATPRAERPNFDDLGGDDPWPFPNQLAQHPPGYYAAMVPVTALATAALGDGPAERSVLALRWVNALIVLPLPLLAAATARRLGADDATVIAASLVPLAVPQVAHIGSSINNDNLLNLLAGTLGLLLAGVVRDDLRSRTAATVGLVAAAGLWTKAPAFSFMAWTAIAYLLPGFADRRWRERLRGALLALSIAVVLGSPWWIRNIVRHGELSPTILDTPGTGGGDLGPLGWPGLYLGRIAQRFWGSFGGYAASLGRPLTAVLTAALLAAVVAAFLKPDVAGRRSRSAPRPSLAVGRLRVAAMSAQILLITLLMTVSSYRHFRLTGDPALMQGRYLFGALIPLAVLVGIGTTRLFGRRGPLAVLAVAVVAHTAAVVAVLRKLWAEPDASLGRSVEALVAWSPLPTVATAVVLLSAVVGLVGLAGRLLLVPKRATATT